jgi:hypothetical protein
MREGNGHGVFKVNNVKGGGVDGFSALALQHIRLCSYLLSSI